jgi:peptidoglycan lytic transglycosylase
MRSDWLSARAVIAAFAFLSATACTGDDAASNRHPAGPAPVATEPAAIPGEPAPAQPPAAPEPPVDPGVVASLTVDMAAPYFTTGTAGAAAQRFALEDWGAARDGFARALKELPKGASDADRARLQLMIALSDAALDRWKPAARGFEQAIAGLPLLADILRYEAARARYFDHDADGALALAQRVAPGSINGADAELLVGDILRGRKDPAVTAAHYRAYLDAHPDGIRLAEARFRLAEALEEGARRGAPSLEAIEIYRRITITDPLSSWSDKAAERLRALYPTLPAADRARYQTLTADELVERGTVYFDSMRNPESEADFAAALTAPGATAETRCTAAYYHAQSAFKSRDRTTSAPAFDAAVEACHAAGDNDLWVKSAYQAGRSYAYLAEHAKSAERYAAAEAADPKHSYADDSRLRQAEAYAELGDDARVKTLLGKLPEIYPQGDMRAEALWRLGWRAYRASAWDEAIGWWKKQIAAVPIDDNYWAEGQPQYWLGRTYARRAGASRNKKAAAADRERSLASYEEAVRTYPLSYYAMLALNRLREEAPERFAALQAEIQAAPPGWDPAAPVFTFQPRHEYALPGFARAVELLKLGLGGRAEAELARLGLEAPGGKKRVEDPDMAEKLWAMAFLYDRAGRYGTSHWLLRWHVLDYKRSWPTGANMARWRIAYPLAYWDLLDRWAQKRGIPTEMLIGIVREESAFNPLMESYANAIGLTQMIFPTANRFARGTGIAVSRDTLRDPEKNVTIGSAFLAFLFQKWKGFTTLIPPSYNAGEGAVTRMLKLRGDWAADEFMEGIVDDQARNYSKRVLDSFFVYSYLKDGTIPVMPNQIPPELVPGKKKGEKVVEPKK